MCVTGCPLSFETGGTMGFTYPIPARWRMCTIPRLSADMCYKLHAQRTWLLQKKLNCRVSVGTATLDHT